ncbi:hypothetical protein D3C83_248030 [compost metagenome]
MIAQAFASALAGMIANLGGFAEPGAGGAVTASAVAWLFVAFALIAALAVPAALRATRLSARQPAA